MFEIFIHIYDLYSVDIKTIFIWRQANGDCDIKQYSYPSSAKITVIKIYAIIIVSNINSIDLIVEYTYELIECPLRKTGTEYYPKLKNENIETYQYFRT